MLMKYIRCEKKLIQCSKQNNSRIKLVFDKSNRILTIRNAIQRKAEFHTGCTMSSQFKIQLGNLFSLCFLKASWILSHQFAKLVLIVTIILIMVNSEVEGKLPKKTVSQKIMNQTEAKSENEVKVETKEEEIDDTPFEKDPHFLVWKILTKLLILTILRATKRFWSPNFNMLGQCYRYYLLVTLALWLHICFDVLMEYVATFNDEITSITDKKYDIS